MEQTKPTLYQTLGVPPDATMAEIRAAYLAKSKTCHPDAGGSTEAFQAIEEAYRVLSDSTDRDHYDRTGAPREDIDRNANAELYGMLGELIEATIVQVDDLKQNDLLHAMRQYNLTAAEKMRKSAAEGRAHLELLKTAHKRLRSKTPDGENRLGAILQHRIENVQGQLDKLSARIALMGQVDAFLKDYHYETDPLPVRFDFAYRTPSNPLEEANLRAHIKEAEANIYRGFGARGSI